MAKLKDEKAAKKKKISEKRDAEASVIKSAAMATMGGGTTRPSMNYDLLL